MTDKRLSSVAIDISNLCMQLYMMNESKSLAMKLNRKVHIKDNVGPH